MKAVAITFLICLTIFLIAMTIVGQYVMEQDKERSQRTLQFLSQHPEFLQHQPKPSIEVFPGGGEEEKL